MKLLHRIIKVFIAARMQSSEKFEARYSFLLCSSHVSSQLTPEASAADKRAVDFVEILVLLKTIIGEI